ncbi:MAG: hypothetical protein ACP5D7_13800 [Limnospira sp.]
MNYPTLRKLGLLAFLGIVGIGAIACENLPRTETEPARNDAVPVAPAGSPPAIEERISLPQPDENRPLPQPGEGGDFSRSSHRTWEVVDPDPQGLNCRMIEGIDSYDELLARDMGDQNFTFDIGNWPVVGTLEQGQDFQIELGPAGFGVIYDTEERPWIYVERTDETGAPSNCFVRANSSFVQPIPTPGGSLGDRPRPRPLPATPQTTLPQPLENGNFPRSPHTTWEAIDPDPNGLNCRMADISEEELSTRNVSLDIRNWPVVATLERGQDFQTIPGPAGLGIVFDTQEQPWLYVKTTDQDGETTTCFVRANSSFVQPIAPESME